MVKTITIKDKVYKKLIAHKGKDESFSDLFERLIEENFHSSIDALKKFRGSVEFEEDKDTILKDIALKRDERRI
ncbi:MAG TPA: antitoxin VapB family protein [Nitrososphaeraceae archaeon]|jgi:predicted CopG family antitoxin|nr:antitoxin VapB family protein [Nitrososphaeraceae archaeon]